MGWIPLEQSLITLFVVTAAGVTASIVGAFVLIRQQDLVRMQLKEQHQEEIATLNRAHAAEVNALKAEISELKRLAYSLLDMFQSKRVLSPMDITKLVMTTSDDSDRTYEALKTLFNLEQLEVLAHDAGIDFEGLGGDTLPVKALRLLTEAQRAGRYGDLLAAIKHARPNAVLT